MDSSEGEAGDGGGAEERDADLSLQALTLPLLTLAVSPERGSSSHTSAMAPTKESTNLPQQGEKGIRGYQAGEAEEPKEECHLSQKNAACSKDWIQEDFEEGFVSGQMKEKDVDDCVEEHSVSGQLPEAHDIRGGEGEEGEEEEETISNQSQTKSKCPLIPQQSQHSSSSITAKASGIHDSRTDTSPKPSHTPSSSPKSFPFSPISPKHFSCPSSSSTLLSESEVKDVTGDQGWISGFPQSFRSQQSLPLVGLELASRSAENDLLTGVPHSSVSTGNGAKALEPNDNQPDTEMDDKKDMQEELKEAVVKHLNQDFSSSVTSQMTMMHSRNSCKTLKCPKCNWHYKSLHTLQAHMKEKHPETGALCACGASGGKCVCGGAARGVCGYCSSGKPHPRLARGETYACGYKPFRCEVCDYATSSKGNLSIHMQSDKHLNNVQNGGNANGHRHTSNVTNNSAPSNSSPADEQPYNKLPVSIPNHMPQPAKITAPPHSHTLGKRWRCDVCDYETSIARNLRIHTTSEKHTHNMLRLQRGYYLSHCRSLAPHLKQLQNTAPELSPSIRLTSQQVSEKPAALGSTLTPSPSPSPSPPPVFSLSPTGSLSQSVFQCLVCSCFSSDSLESVEQHLNVPRSLPQSEWCSLIAGGCHCRLCGYTTPLRANFSLHCQTDRHRTRYQLAAHLQEGGDRGQEGAALITKGNPIQLRCNLCDYLTSSLEKLRLHALSKLHEASVRVYRFLQQYDGEVDGGSWVFHCLLCNHSSSSKLQVLKHGQTSAHLQREGVLQLQPMDGEELAAIFTIRKSSSGITEEINENITIIETSTDSLESTKDLNNMAAQETYKIREKAKLESRERKECLPTVKRSPPENEEMEHTISTKRAKVHQQNENQQTVQCPLCQVKLLHTHLRQHLTHLHSVAQDCVDKLISAVNSVKEQCRPQLETDLLADTLTNDPQTSNPTENKSVRCPRKECSPFSLASNKQKVENSEEDVIVPKDVPALLTPPLEDNATQPSDSIPAPQSPSLMPPSSPSSSPPDEPPPLSDRHGYRFRCSRCSLAFPTHEKLQLHWQYHAMRAATECPLCSRQCRSQEALQRHMQNIHSQQDDTNGQKIVLQSQLVPYIESNNNPDQQKFSLSPKIGQEAGVGDEEMNEVAADIEKMEDPIQEQVKDNEVGLQVDCGNEDSTEPEQGLNDKILLESSSSSLVKKSINSTMDRFLDPSRPYKCTICSESFTQKTILLVHYNSVSHLHRARRASQDSGMNPAATETSRGPDPRPYRCRLCGVGYSQSSTLDIHLRSVLHQTRARAAQNSASQALLSSMPVLVPSTSAEATTPREESTKSFADTKKMNGERASSSSLLGPGVFETQPTLSDLIENHHAKKRVVELLASRNQLMLMQQQQMAQAQVQAHVQHQKTLFQSHALQNFPIGNENLLKQPFSLTTDNSLSLQQQLLLPFYLSGDRKFNSELSILNSDVGQLPSLNSTTKDNEKADSKGEFVEDEKQTLTQSSNSAVSQPVDHCQTNANFEIDCSGREAKSKQIEHHNRFDTNQEKETKHVNIAKSESQKGDVSPRTDTVSSQCPPPRVPYAAANGEPLKALLQSYGYELAMQYLQSRHRNQQQIATQMINAVNMGKVELCSENRGDKPTSVFSEDLRSRHNVTGVESTEASGEKEQNKDANSKKKCCETGEKCQDCGKFFSDVLILKSHQEYIHNSLFPSATLEKFSREYRLQYDQMYPTPTQPNSEMKSNISDEVAALAPTTCLEPAALPVKPQEKLLEPSTKSQMSDITIETCDLTCESASFSTSSQTEPKDSQAQEALISGTSVSASPQNTTPILLPLPKIPLLPLSLPPLSIPPLTIPKLSLPSIPFPMDLPLLPPVVMQSMALQTQPWLESTVSPELTKLYHSQINQALLGHQPQITQSLLAQQPQINPLLGQTSQLSSPLLGQPLQSSPIQIGQQSQVSPSTPEQQQSKRTRTRISEEQLTILRKNFDINSLPNDEEINKMSSLSGLPHKVIKHWFRNTLFKERQRDKDSPYNFSNPPTTPLEELREDAMQNQNITLSPCSLSPEISTNNSPQPQTTDPLKGESQRTRRSSRTRFTEKQLQTLQGVFEASPYPREEEYDRLSALLSLPNRVIVVWFQNARQRARKSQDRGPDDGFEGKSQANNAPQHKVGDNKNEELSQSNSYQDDGEQDSQNENSMDLTYEYYTHPDSPTPDFPSHCTDGEISATKEEKTQCKKVYDDLSNLCAKKNPAFAHNLNISNTHIQQKNITTGLGRSETKLPSQSIVDNPPSFADSFEKTAINPILSMSHPDPGEENTIDLSVSNFPSVTKSETIHTQQFNGMAGPSIETQTPPQAQSEFQCNLCSVSLPSLQQWQEHQTRHLLAAQSQAQLLHSGFSDRTMPYMMLHPNHTLMASQMLSGAIPQIHSGPTQPIVPHKIQVKNTLSDQSNGTFSSSLKQIPKPMSDTSFEGQKNNREAEEERRRDKRQRTTITPEQLEVLYQRYSLDSNPTRGVLENIARDVGLTRRVVQVWFQNTRARERKGQFRSVGPGSSFTLGLNHLRCPFCRALFKVKSALDAHMRSRHWAEAERAGYNLSGDSGSSRQNGIGLTSAMEKASSSTSNLIQNNGYTVTNKELTMKSIASCQLSPTTNLSNLEEDDYEEDDEEYPCDENSVMGDQRSPTPEGSGGQSSDETQSQPQHHHQQQRQRTQMSHLQVLQLKNFYKNHRTPNRQECESLGQQLGLSHRVVQVWFQNARAKEKRARGMSSDSAEKEQAEMPAGAGERDRA